MNKLQHDMLSLPGFRTLLEYAGQIPVFLVGGALRDWQFGQPVKDVDLATDGNPTALAQEFARHTGGSWFWLDRQRCQSRVVLKCGSETFSYDFSPLRAATIETDLADRDFTLNAMAVKLGGKDWALIDPCGAGEDIRDRRLRVCSPDSLRNDPLRVLRGVRFALQFNLVPTTGTEAAMVRDAGLLTGIPGERIHAELAVILNTPGSSRILPLWFALDLMPVLFGFSCSVDFGRQLAQQFDRLEQTLSQGPAWLHELAAGTVANNFSRLALLKLHLMLSGTPGADKGRSAQVADRLCLGRRNATALNGLLHIGDCLPCPRRRRAQRLWLEDLPGNPRVSLLGLLLDSVSEQTCHLHLDRLDPRVLKDLDKEPPEPLIPVARMMDRFGFRPGPELGRALAELRRMEILEQIKTSREAEAHLLRGKQKAIDKGESAP
ncbi:hypothetical protein C2E25_14370 [Geothermobacter hydrogeniphilus]|uniref:Poly A polymerase head domain-containing protein n=1 Tax=Geothermobacter hydrogeniphilus TaxID=1969733 RepID=A0A2K2H721_9BACT|nr:CCA tRNA nucleotidyltransferase [Geothermobacter hydrogeniphilus]PNU19059.1 hypothetical protein C2E25_14370 [Geothermobacter hydrogeniphilus]